MKLGSGTNEKITTREIMKINLILLLSIIPALAHSGGYKWSSSGYVDISYLSIDNLDLNPSTKDNYTSLYGIGGLSLTPSIGSLSFTTTIRGYQKREDSSHNNIKTQERFSKAIIDEIFLNLGLTNGITAYSGRRYIGVPNDIGFYFGPPTWPYGGGKKDLLADTVDSVGIKIWKNKSHINAFIGSLNYKEMGRTSIPDRYNDIPKLVGINMWRSLDSLYYYNIWLNYYTFLNDVKYYQQWGIFNNIPPHAKLSLWEIGASMNDVLFGEDGRLSGNIKYYRNVLKGVPNENRKRKAFYMFGSFKIIGPFIIIFESEIVTKDSDFIPINSNYKPGILLTSLDNINGVAKGGLKIKVYDETYIKIDWIKTSGKRNHMESDKKEKDIILDSSLSSNFSFKLYHASVSEDYLSGETKSFGVNVKYSF